MRHWEKSVMSFVSSMNVYRCRQNKTKCTYNVTLRRVRVTFVAVKKQELLHILSVCR
jgi:hypothetical protein